MKANNEDDNIAAIHKKRTKEKKEDRICFLPFCASIKQIRCGWWNFWDLTVRKNKRIPTFVLC